MLRMRGGLPSKLLSWAEQGEITLMKNTTLLSSPTMLSRHLGAGEDYSELLSRH